MSKKAPIPAPGSRILISWIAWYKDYIQKEGQISEITNHNGPTFDLHRRYVNSSPEATYHKHIILTSAENGDLKSVTLYSELQNNFPDRDIELRPLDVRDIFDFQELKAKTGKILNEFKDFDIDILFSNGTTPMRMVWVLHHLEKNYKTRLIQGKDRRATKGDPGFQVIALDWEEFPWRLEARAEDMYKTLPGEQGFTLTPILESLYASARKIALSHDPKVSALILGESGTGKERLARFIHDHSSRKSHPFETVNCAAIPDTLAESLLFGYTKGSFSGAEKDNPGFFSRADGGTLFLDEIGDASPYVQQVLLRVLQERTIRPVGGVEREIDVKVLAATNRNLRDRIQEGKFRWDLYWRISTVVLRLPELKDFPAEEKRSLIHNFLQQKAHSALRHPLRLTPSLEKWMISYTFPGNIRELENLITHFYVMAGNEVTLDDLPEDTREQIHGHSLQLKDIEKAHILKILKMENNKYKPTARVLGIAYNTLINKLKEYGVYQ
ncbi:MAG: sigma 54-interacting transcriptional regulator [Bacteroidia bacterium]|nr:sigma 54-interacting transcriptional regulator [Bacteroidia bacterium]